MAEGARQRRERERARADLAKSERLLAEAGALLLQMTLALAARGVPPKNHSLQVRAHLHRALARPHDTP